MSSKVNHFCRETLHGRLKKRLQPSENDRVLKIGLLPSKPDYFSHSGPQGAEGGHHEEVGLGLAETRLIAFLIRISKLLVMATCWSWGGVSLDREKTHVYT
jgi:hypothetical protein